MTNIEAQKVLDELKTVRPSLLNDDARRLFETIMKIADERDSLLIENKNIKRQLNIKNEYLRLIAIWGGDYEGLDSSMSRMEFLVKQIVDYAEKGINNDDKSAIYNLPNNVNKNILSEEI